MTLADHIEFGFPLNYFASGTPTPMFRNHKEDTVYAHHVTDYIRTELQEGALLGLFVMPPFTPWAQCRPIMTRPKSMSGKCRIIMDLSFPLGASVNTSGAGCIRVMSAVAWLMRRQGFHAIIYSDDFVGCEASLA